MAEFNVGEYVNTPSDAIGKIVKKKMECKVVYTVQFNSGNTDEYEGFNLKPAPKLTPDEAWERLPILVIEQVESLKSRSYYHGEAVFVLFASERSDIRHECYKFLGGSGVKVDNAVKERVTKRVEDVARALGIRVI